MYKRQEQGIATTPGEEGQCQSDHECRFTHFCYIREGQQYQTVDTENYRHGFVTTDLVGYEAPERTTTTVEQVLNRNCNRQET